MSVKSSLLRAGVIIAALMFAATALPYMIKPTIKLVDLQHRRKLETLLPMQFGDWRNKITGHIVLADPRMIETLSRIYTETINRNYFDTHGRQIMLSIAYGEDQRDGMNVHYPESCYPAQGFQTRAVRNELLTTPYGVIRVKRLEMELGQRYEVVTYWTMIGEYSTLGDTSRKLKEMRYTLNGIIPDGLLFRVSSIGRDTKKAYRDHEEFIAALLGTLNPEDRKRLSGL